MSNGSLFHKKSLNMGPIFYKNIPKHGSVFFFFQKFSKLWKIGLYSRKMSQNLYFFSAKMTLKGRYGFWGSISTPLSKPNLSTPWAFSLYMYLVFILWISLIGVKVFFQVQKAFCVVHLPCSWSKSVLFLDHLSGFRVYVCGFYPVDKVIWGEILS